MKALTAPFKHLAAAAKLVGIGLLWLSCNALAAEVVATVSHLRGTLSVQRADGSQALLAVNSEIQQGDVLTTTESTYARVKFKDQSEVVLRPATQLKVDSFNFNAQQPQNDNLVLELVKGGLRKITGLIGKRNHTKDQLKTPVATIGIRGTHYGLLLCRPHERDCQNIPTVTGRELAHGLHVDVAAGEIQLDNEAGHLAVKAGQFSYVENLKTPPVIVPPEQGVQVTIPPSILKNKSDGRNLDTDNSEDSCLIQ